MATALLKDPASPSSDEREIEKEEEGSGKVASSVDSGKVKVQDRRLQNHYQVQTPFYNCL